MSIDEFGLSAVTVKKAELLESLRKNREAHRTTFLDAQKGYREAVIKELDQMLADAREGKNIRKSVELPTPYDHTSDYDRVIKMLEMCVHDEIKITDSQFQQFVMDDWKWKQQFADVASGYTTGRR